MTSERGPALRALYGVVLLGLAASAIAATWPELAQLWFALSRPYHFGAPPQPLPIGGTLLVFVGLGIVFSRWLRSGRAPLWALALVLVGAALPLFGLWSDVPQGRSWAAADSVILDVGHQLRRRVVERLRAEGRMPPDEAAWQSALDAAAGETPSPVRDRTFERVPFRIVRIAERTARPETLVPGTYLVWASEAGDAFEIHPVGFAPDGDAARLVDGQGAKVVLRGGMKQAGWRDELPQRRR